MECISCHRVDPPLGWYADGRKTCRECRQTKARERYRRKAKDPEYKAQEAKRHRDSPRPDAWKWRRRAHGLNAIQAREYTAGKLCAICGQTEKLVVDHDHVSGRIRGALCFTCNAGLGMFKDDPALFARAIEYLKVA